MEEASKSSRLVSAPLWLLKEGPYPVQARPSCTPTITCCYMYVFLDNLLVPWTLVTWGYQLENLFQLDLKFRLQHPTTSSLDPFHKFTLFDVGGSILLVFEGKHGLTEPVVDPEDGEVAARLGVRGAEVGGVGVHQGERGEGVEGGHLCQEILSRSFYFCRVFLFFCQLGLGFHNLFDLSTSKAGM